MIPLKECQVYCLNNVNSIFKVWTSHVNQDGNVLSIAISFLFFFLFCSAWLLSI